MPTIEDLYQQAIDEMSPLQKMARVEGYLYWTRELIARKVREEIGNDASDERVKLEVALRMYQADPGMERLIREQIARVSA